MGHIQVGHRGDYVAMNLLDITTTSNHGYHYVLVVADYFTEYIEYAALPDKTAQAVADTLSDN